MTDEFFSKHIDNFLSESISHIENMNSSLLEWEKNPKNANLLHDVFRSTHTLKSMSGTMNFTQMMQLCHAIEDILDAIRHKRMTLKQCADFLFECIDLLNASVKAISENGMELETALMCERAQHILFSETKTEKQESADTQIIFPPIEKLKTIGVKVERLDVLMNLVEELLVSRIKLDFLRESINNYELTAAIDSLGRHITDLQYIVMQVRLVPIGFLFNRFPRMVRDLSKNLEKEVDLKIEGADIELDRSLIDEISESLVHLIRNAIDHGLESTEVRIKAKKPSHSTIVLSAKRDKEFAEIEVSDDGEGLDLPRIKSLAMNKNILTADATDEEVINSIFKGISTSKKVTDISGRGLGLSIVKQKIESIGGSVQVKSKAGEGTRFILRIPLTLAVIKALFVTVNDQIYAIPINNVERLLTFTTSEVKGLINFNAIVYEGEDIPITHLAKLFSAETKIMDRYPVVVVKQGEDRLGIVVDTLLSTQEVVIKPLVKVVRENRYFSGTALIGSGEMVLIIDTDQLFLSRRQQNEWRATSTV